MYRNFLFDASTDIEADNMNDIAKTSASKGSESCVLNMTLNCNRKSDIYSNQQSAELYFLCHKFLWTYGNILPSVPKEMHSLLKKENSVCKLQIKQ